MISIVLFIGYSLLPIEQYNIHLHNKQTNKSLLLLLSSSEESQKMDPRGRSTASTTHDTLAPNSMKVF